MMLSIVLMLPVMIMLMMDKGKHLGTSNSNMSPKHQSMFQGRVNHLRIERDLTPLWEDLEVQMDKGVPGQSGGGSNLSVMKTKIVENVTQLTT